MTAFNIAWELLKARTRAVKECQDCGHIARTTNTNCRKTSEMWDGYCNGRLHIVRYPTSEQEEELDTQLEERGWHG